jgi:hypothetical protein
MVCLGGYGEDGFVAEEGKKERKKERNALHEGPLKGIGSSVGMQPYMGVWVSTLGGTSS